MTNYGERLYQLRKRYSLTQRDLAKILGISRQAVSRWETEENEPSEENLDQICSIFHLSKEYFFCAKFDPAYLDESYFSIEEIAASECGKGEEANLAEIALTDTERKDSAEADGSLTDDSARGLAKGDRTKRLNLILMVSWMVVGILFILSLILTIVFGKELFNTVTHDAVVTSYDQSNWFYIFLGLTVLLLVVQIIIFHTIFRRKSKSKLIDN